MAFDRISPIGAVRGDIRAASICQAIAASNHPKDVPPLLDFALKYDLGGYDDDGVAPPKPDERYTTEEEKAKFAAAMAASLKRVKARKAERDAAEAEKRRTRRAEKLAAKLAAKAAAAAALAAKKAERKGRNS